MPRVHGWDVVMERLQDGVAKVAQTAKATADAYRGDDQRPLGGYVVIMALFGALLSGAAGLASATGRRLPAGVGPWDLVLLAARTHKLSRTLTKDAVTSPLRAPFTRYQPPLEQAQRHELPPRHAGQGPQHEAQQDRGEPGQRHGAQPARGGREPAPARVGAPRPAHRQRGHG